VAELRLVSDTLEALREGAAVEDEEATPLRLAVDRVRAVADSTDSLTPQGDLRLFLVAEVARDSLGAPTLAATLFRRIVEQSPTSPYAPKAVFAAQQLDSAWADTAQALLAERYADSPYLAMLRGEDAPGYRLLEDSLRNFAAVQAIPRPPGGVLRRPVDTDRAPVVTPRRRPAVTDSLDAPGRRTGRSRPVP
jgi:hypothetical protein